MISGIVHAKNEESMIAWSIRSLDGLASEVIVADMASTDRTVAIAESLGARVIRVEDHGYMETALAASHREARYGWVLRLDADEVLPQRLQEALLAAVESDKYDCVSIPRRNLFFGQPMSSAGWEPDADRHIRLYRRGMLKGAAIPLHGGALDLDSARILQLPAEEPYEILHFNYVSWNDYFSRLDRYTSVEALRQLEANTQLGTARTAWRAMREGYQRLVVHRAWRDGYRGVALALSMVLYRLVVAEKAEQLRRGDHEDRVIAHYTRLAEQALARDRTRRPGETPVDEG